MVQMLKISPGSLALERIQCEAAAPGTNRVLGLISGAADLVKRLTSLADLKSECLSRLCGASILEVVHRVRHFLEALASLDSDERLLKWSAFDRTSGRPALARALESLFLSVLHSRRPESLVQRLESCEVGAWILPFTNRGDCSRLRNECIEIIHDRGGLASVAQSRFRRRPD